MNVVEINRISDIVIVVAINFGTKIVRIVGVYAPQWVRSMSKKKFCDKKAKEGEVENKNKVLICLRNFNGHIGKEVDKFEGVHEGFEIGKKNVEGRLLSEFFC